MPDAKDFLFTEDELHELWRVADITPEHAQFLIRAGHLKHIGESRHLLIPLLLIINSIERIENLLDSWRHT